METNKPPNRMEQRHYVVNDYPDKSILELCGYWHGQIIGAYGVAITNEELDIARKFLLVCLENWQPSVHMEDFGFDEAVNELIKATLKEIYRCQEGRKADGSH